MPCPRHQIALVKVIRPHPHLHQFMHQLALDVYAIVHPRQQDRLVAQRNARPREPITRGRKFGRNLLWVVHMNVQPKGVVLGQHLAQLGRDHHRQKDGQAGAHADNFHMGNGPQAAEERIQQFERQNERVAPREQHIAHLGVAGDISNLRLEIALAEIVGGVAHNATASAITAVAGALGRHQH